MRTLITAIAFTLLVPVLALAQKTSFDFDKAADFSTFKTYTVKDGTKVGQPLIDARIDAAIEKEMAGKGFTRQDASPDVVVVYHVAFDKQQDITAYSTGGGGGYGPYAYRWGGGWGTTTTDVRVNNILVGTLVIDMVDAKKGEMVWRGMGVKEVNTSAKPEQRDKSINGAVAKMFKNYPPKQKK